MRILFSKCFFLPHYFHHALLICYQFLYQIGKFVLFERLRTLMSDDVIIIRKTLSFICYLMSKVRFCKTSCINYVRDFLEIKKINNSVLILCCIYMHCDM